jgi:hypothetical protein
MVHGDLVMHGGAAFGPRGVGFNSLRQATVFALARFTPNVPFRFSFTSVT